jgi:microcystin-dependent protein
MATPFIAEIRIMGFGFPPRSWATCQGQLLPINQNQALFSLLGTTYGGNGTTTFQLPDLRGRAPVHAGQGPGLSNISLGQISGQENVTLLTTQLPSHSHTASASSAAPSVGSPANNAWATGGSASYASTGGASMSATALSTTGGSQPHPNIQPSLVVNFCIALVGIFPSRN